MPALHATRASWIPLALLLGCTGDDPATDSGASIPVMETSTVETGGDDTGTPPGPSFAVALDEPVFRVVRGASRRLRVELDRDDGYDGPVELVVTGLPDGVTAAASTAPAGAVEWEVELTASGSAAPGGPTTITVAATPQAGPLQTVEASLYVAGSPGSLDPSFSFDGVLTYDVDPQSSEGLSDIALDGEGRLLVVGGFGAPSTSEGYLVRFERDGSLDTGFGPGGSGPDFPDGVPRQVAVRTGDRPLVIASVGLGRVVAAVDASGAHESGWGTDGEVLLTEENGPTYPGMLLPSAGGLLVVAPGGFVDLDDAGVENVGFDPDPATVELASAVLDIDERVLVGSTREDFYAVERRGRDGGLDPTFGVDGQLRFGVGAPNGWVRELAATADGGGVGVVQSFPSSIPSDPTLFRFDASGQLDAAFGSGGTVLLTTGAALYTAVAVQRDGRIVVVGSDFLDHCVERFNPDGSRDSSFGTAGVVNLPGSPVDVVLDEEAGRILVAVTDNATEGIDVHRLWQ